ncbi:phage tail fiber protein [Xenorhabdus nematophila]
MLLPNADAAWGGVDGGVEIPICKNKLPLIWVNYEVLPDGSIKLMVYHREHPNALEFAKNVHQDYSGEDLSDIPVGRSISVRVQMPEDSVWNVRGEWRSVVLINPENHKKTTFAIYLFLYYKSIYYVCFMKEACCSEWHLFRIRSYDKMADKGLRTLALP